MRVLHVTDASSAGVLTSVTTLARAQASSPLFSTVALAYVPRADSPSEQEIQQLVGPQARVEKWSSSIGVSRLLALARETARTLRLGNYDLIHCHSSRGGFIVRLTALLAQEGNRVVYSPHFFAFAQTNISSLERSVYLFMEKVAALKDGRIIVVSHSEAATARAALPHARIAVLSNAVDNHSLSIAARRYKTKSQIVQNEARQRERRVVHVGRIAEQKDPSLFSSTIEEVTKSAKGVHGEVRAIWLGDGKRSLLEDRRIPVQVSGWLPPQALREQLALADVLLFTSRGEGMPMALLEAQGMGVPVVASNVPGVTDVIEHGTNGFLGTSSTELAGYLARLLRDDRLHRQMSNAGIQRSRLLFDTCDLAERSASAYLSTKIGSGAQP